MQPKLEGRQEEQRPRPTTGREIVISNKLHGRKGEEKEEEEEERD